MDDSSKILSMDEVYRMIEAEIAERKSNQLHIDSRLCETLRLPNKKSPAKLILFNDASEFLRLLFHLNDGSRILTPPGKARRLQDCAKRMIEGKLSFEGLSKTHPGYFEKCLPIYENFDYDSFHSVFLLDLCGDDERNGSMNANFSIYDGTHKTLVLAYKLLAEELTFRPVRAFLFTDRNRVVL